MGRGKSARVWALLFLGLGTGACATGGRVSAQATTTTVADPVVMPAPVYVVQAAPTERVILPAPPPAPARVVVAAPPAQDAAQGGAPVGVAPVGAAPAQEAFTPRDSPLLALNDRKPHGEPAPAMDPLLSRGRGGRWTVRPVNWGYYGYAPYYGYTPYYGYGYGYTPYYYNPYRAAYLGYGPYYGASVGIGFGRPYGWGRGFGHHHHHVHHYGGHHHRR